MGGDAAPNDHIATGCGSGNHQGSGFNLVRNHRIVGTVQVLLTTNANHIRTCTLDLGAHAIQEVGQVHNVWFFGGVINHGGALGLRCRQHHIDGAAHGHHVKENVTAPKLIRLHNDHAAPLFRLGTQCLKSLQVLVNGAGTDFAAAGSSHHGPSAPSQQCAQQVIAGTQPPSLLKAHLMTFGRPRVNGHKLIGHIGYLCAEGTENIHQCMDVLDIRQVLYSTGFICQQGSWYHGHCRVLAATDPHLALQCIAARDQHSFFLGHRGLNSSRGLWKTTIAGINRYALSCFRHRGRMDTTISTPAKAVIR